MYETNHPEKTMRDVQYLMTDLYYSSNDDKIDELLKDLYSDFIEYNEQIKNYSLNLENRQNFIWEKLIVCAYGKNKDNTPTEAWTNLRDLEERWSSIFYTPLQSSTEVQI